MRALYWDFFGPKAEARALHYRKHLDEFIAKHAVAGAESGVVSQAAGHYAAFCRAPAEAALGIQRSLRPTRMEPDTGSD